MLATTHSFTLDGIAASRIRVEVDVHTGLPTFSIVGLPDAAVREARERVRAALVNSGFDFPLHRITVNLAPASLRKAGPGLDLAIAAGLLVASGQLEPSRLEGRCLVGELALDGRVRAVPGVLAMAEEARASGADGFFVPADNAGEAALVPGLIAHGVHSLGDLARIVEGKAPPDPALPLDLMNGGGSRDPDLADLRGQPLLRRALEVAAAGGHNLLMIGPPGVGKSLAARRLPSVLPPMAPSEALEVAKIRSACGLLETGELGKRPFRAPHHTISGAGLVGGGPVPRPGEITLAHRGVLFLDEICEFRRDALEALRAPIEDGEVAISRAGGRIRLPSRFMLVAASNPCPCGRGEESAACTCTPAAIARYHSKLSAALSDRMEILVSLTRPSTADLSAGGQEGSDAVRSRTQAARAIQSERLGKGRCNAGMTPDEVRATSMEKAARALLEAACERDQMSGRAHDRALRLARTVADLDESEMIGEGHMAAALAFRRR